MLPEKYRRLWRRRLRRRPLLPFLLAAFVAVDMSLFCFDSSPEPEGYLLVLSVGFLLGQVALLGAWVASRRFGIATRLTWSALITAAISMPVVLTASDSTSVYLAVLLAYLAMSIAIASVVEFLAGFRRGGLRRRLRYQFTIGLLVGITTATPLAIWAVKYGQWSTMADSAVVASFLIEAMVLGTLLALNAFIKRTSYLSISYAVVALGFLTYGYFTSEATVPALSVSYFLGYLLAVGGGMLVVRWRRQTTDRPRLERLTAPLHVSADSIDLSA
jgi:hypothetical protein